MGSKAQATASSPPTRGSGRSIERIARSQRLIFLGDGATGEPVCAMIRGGGTINREPDEPREAFEARASAGAPAAIHLPSDGMAALATGKTPQWAKGKLVLQVVEERLESIL